MFLSLECVNGSSEMKMSEAMLLDFFKGRIKFQLLRKEVVSWFYVTLKLPSLTTTHQSLPAILPMWSTATGLELAALALPFCHLRVQDLATLIEDGKVVLYHACNWYPHRVPPLFEVQGDVSQSWVRVGFFQFKSSRKSAFLISSQVTSQMHH